MKYFRSFPFAVWFIVAVAGVVGITVATIHGGDPLPVRHQRSDVPFQMSYAMPELLANARISGTEAASTARRLASMALSEADRLDLQGDSEQASTVRELGEWTQTITPALNAGEAQWRADVLARAVTAVVSGEQDPISDEQWETNGAWEQPKLPEGQPDAAERVATLQQTLPAFGL